MGGGSEVMREVMHAPAPRGVSGGLIGSLYGHPALAPGGVAATAIAAQAGQADVPDAFAALAAIFGLPFAEQVAFFRGKLGRLVPTETWRDMMREAHDRAFMVAGAAKADLLADLAAAADRAIAEGEGIEAFRKRFGEIVKKHGWQGWTGSESEAGTAWRTRVIYRTNMATSYAAGRLAQLQHFPLWVYRHSGAEHPRLEHKAWDGLTLPREHPFWQTHFPPNGWGCGCRCVGASSPEGARRLGGDPGYDTPPDGWDTRDGRGRLPGIDEGWDYMPGGTVADAVRALAGKLDLLPRAPSVDLIQAWLAAEAFARWYEKPTGNWPLARLPDADAQALGAREGVRVALLSDETARKQRREHPELAPADYAAAQRIVDAESTIKVPYTDKDSGRKRMIYIQEHDLYVLVVKATLEGDRLYVTTLYRLHSDEARRDREIARLLRKGKKNEAAPGPPRGTDASDSQAR